MPIVNSQFIPDAHTQRDGTRYVVENHTDSTGKTHVIMYRAASGTDYVAVMNARVASLNEQLADTEFQSCLENNTLTTDHMTKEQVVSKFRKLYRSASKDQLAKLAAWLVARVQAGDVTPAQIQTAFSLTPAQYTTLRDKMIALRDHYNAVQLAEGE